MSSVPQYSHDSANAASSKSTLSGLRADNDPHAHQPFCRYYLGPSPIASSEATRVAAALKEDSETLDPYGVAIAGREGFTLVRPPKALAESGDSDDGYVTEEEGTAGAPNPHDSSLRRPSQAFQNANWPRTASRRRRLQRDPSATSAFSHASLYSAPETSHGAASNGNQPRSSTPPGARSTPRPGLFRAANDSEGHDLLPSTARRRSFVESSLGPQGRRHGIRSEGGAGSPVGVGSPDEVCQTGVPSHDFRRTDRPLSQLQQSHPESSAPLLKVPSQTEDRTLRDVSSIRSLAPSQRSSHHSLRNAFSRIRSGNASSVSESFPKSRAGSSVPHSNAEADTSPKGTHAATLSGTPMTATADLPTSILNRTTDGNIPQNDLLTPAEAAGAQPGDAQRIRQTNVRSPSVARFAELERPRRDESFVSFQGRTPALPHGASKQASRKDTGESRQKSQMQGHGRDFSRQSRMSRASTAGTFTSMGFGSSAGSFGASGGFRAKIARAFRPRSYTSRETPATERSRTRVTAAELAGQVAEVRRHWRGGVAPGQVGTSSGGTKWVGQSFEVGQRFWHVIESRERELLSQRTQSTDGRRRSFVLTQGDNGIIVEQQEDDRASADDAADGDESASQKGKTDRRQMLRTASAVLDGFAIEASMVQDQREEKDQRGHDKRAFPKAELDQAQSKLDAVANVANPETADAASIRALAPPKLVLPTDAGMVAPSAETRAQKESPQAKKVGLRKLAASASGASRTKAGAKAQAEANALAEAIESRHGWSDIASMMSAQSSLQANNLAKAIADKAEERFKLARRSMRQGKGKDPKLKLNARDVDRRDSRKSLSVIGGESMISSPATSPPWVDTPAQVFKTPLEMPGGATSGGLSAPAACLDDYFGDSVTATLRDSPKHSPTDAKQNAPVPGRMTVEEATTHPQPPLAAEEKFPEATFALLRKPSDLAAVGSPDGVRDAASDHAVAVNNVGMDDSSVKPDRAFSPVIRSAEASKLGATPGNDTAIALRPKASTSSMVVHEEQPVGTFGRAATTAPETKKDYRKKRVQFDKLTVGRPILPFRSPSSSSAPQSEEASKRKIRNSSRPGDAAPAAPELVLSRPHSTSHSNAGSPADEKELPSNDGRLRVYDEEEFITPRSTLRRDRMLVKMDWTPSEAIPQDLDEHTCRRFSIHPGTWREYIVVLRQGRVELWGDPTRTAKLKGQRDTLHLDFVIPLSRGSTYLSMFSHIDRIFCLTYAQQVAATHLSGVGKHRMLNLRKTGTNILLFTARSISTAADWTWDLWREVGGLIPENLDIKIPAYDLVVRFPIPEEIPCENASEVMQKIAPGSGQLALLSHDGCTSGGEGYKLMNRRRLTATMLALVSKNKEYQEVLQTTVSRGARLELAWRRDNILDWIIHDRTLDGQARDWSVLCGTVLKEARQPATLEYRVASHYPTTVTLADGQKLVEPPGIEGFIWRVKPVSGVLTRLYVTTHDHHAFVCKPSKAFAPDRHIAVGPDSVAKSSQADQGALGGGPPSRFRRRSMSIASGGGEGSIWDDAASGRSGVGSRRGSASQRSASGAYGQRRRDSFGIMGESGKRAKRTKRRDASTTALRQHAMETIARVAQTSDDMASQVEAYRAFERRRQFDQIANADGYIDVKDIYMIRYLGEDHPGGKTGGYAKKPGVEGPDLNPMPMPTPEGNHPDDEPDLGGEEGLNMSSDRAAMRRARQFEVIMNNGRSTRFEAYSRSVAQEWVSRLHDISSYWKRREKVDALEAMEVCGFDPALIRRQKPHDKTTAAEPGNMRNAVFAQTSSSNTSMIDPSNTSQNLLLGNIWNWCTILACRGIIRSGRLFVKDRPHAPFHSRQYILISGRLLCFRLMTNTRTARARQNAGIFYKRAGGIGAGKGSGGVGGSAIPLRDSYVWSGGLTDPQVGSVGRAEAAGAMGQFASGGAADTGSSTRHRVPRLYGDGLLSVDEDEDCTFVLRYRVARVNAPGEGPGLESVGRGNDVMVGRDATAGRKTKEAEETVDEDAPAAKMPAPIPPLADDGHYAILTLRARSRLERDLWVRAINGERERLARANKSELERELKIRNHGQTPWKSHNGNR